MRERPSLSELIEGAEALHHEPKEDQNSPRGLYAQEEMVQDAIIGGWHAGAAIGAFVGIASLVAFYGWLVVSGAQPGNDVFSSGTLFSAVLYLTTFGGLGYAMGGILGSLICGWLVSRKLPGC